MPDMASLNPYEPPHVEQQGDAVPEVIRGKYHLTRRELSTAESHFLIRKRPILLLTVSLACIVLAVGLMLAANRWADMLVFPALVLGLVIAASMYLLAIHATKQRVRAAMREHGLLDAQHYQLVIDPTTTRVVANSQTWVWKNGEVQMHSCPGGLLLQPTPDLFVLVPKRGEFNTTSFRNLRVALRQRLTATSTTLAATQG